VLRRLTAFALPVHRFQVVPTIEHGVLWLRARTQAS
jgi:hypothetical protein